MTLPPKSLSWSSLLANPPKPIPVDQLPTHHDAILETEQAIDAHKSDTIIAIDLETTGLRHWKDEIRVVQFYGYPSNKLSILHYPTGVLPTSLVEFINSKKDILWLGQNVITFDMRFLEVHGIHVLDLPVWDTLLIEGIINSSYRDPEDYAGKNDLQSLIARHLGINIPKLIDHNTWQTSLFPNLTEEQLMYAADDVRYMINLLASQITALRDPHTRRTANFETLVAKPVLQMSLVGLPLDRFRYNDFIAENLADMNVAKDELQSALKEEVEKLFPDSQPPLTNLDSPTQLLKHPAITARHLTSTAKVALNEYLRDHTEDTLIPKLVKYRQHSQRNKLYSYQWLQDYLTRTGNVASSYTQTATGTYRTSSKNPNAQNYPRNIRNVFGNPNEYMLIADYSTIEMRVCAVLTQERRMIQAFNNGLDIHSTSAASLFNKPLENVEKDERQAAKAANFAMIFAGGADSLIRQAEQLGLSTIEIDHAEEMKQIFFETYPELNSFHRTLSNNVIRNYYHEDSYRVRNQETFERIKELYDDSNPNYLTVKIGYNPEYPERWLGHTRRLYRHVGDLKLTSALNTPIQGTAAIIIKAALRYIYNNYPEMIPYMAATVHDEIILAGYKHKEDAEAHKPMLEDAMIKAAEYICPGVHYEVEASVVNYWNESK